MFGRLTDPPPSGGPASGGPASAGPASADPESAGPASGGPPSFPPPPPVLTAPEFQTTADLSPAPQATPTATAQTAAAKPTHRQPAPMLSSPAPAPEQGPCQRAHWAAGKDL